MRLDEIRRTVALIERTARGEESTPVKDAAAHDLEDDLFRQVLSAIADGAPHAQGLARAAIESLNLPFSRRSL